MPELKREDDFKLFRDCHFNKNQKYARFYINIGIVTLAVFIVILICYFDNTMPPRWDTVYYLDMASHGIIKNQHLVAPFAYRPAIPLIIGVFVDFFHANPLNAFHYAASIGSVGFIITCYWFARSQAITERAALITTVSLSLYFCHIKSLLFHQTPIDIFAFLIFIFAFSQLLDRRFYFCLLVSGIGLFFKEFLIIPILIQMADLIWRNRSTIKVLTLQLIATMFTVILCFALPRWLIPVTASFQEIDLVNKPQTISRLITNLLNLYRDLNIFFAYCAYWLPTLLLINKERFLAIRSYLSKKKLFFIVYIIFHFLLVMYGGTNLTLFVSYLVVAQILILGTLISKCFIPWWELALMLIIVSIFNRIWWPIPTPTANMSQYMEYYGGYSALITLRTFHRFGEIAMYLLSFWLIRRYSAQILANKKA